MSGTPALEWLPADPMEAELVAGYRDGFEDDRPDLPTQSNRTRLYGFGWLNGRDDRMRSPRATAATLRVELADLMRGDG